MSDANSLPLDESDSDDAALIGQWLNDKDEGSLARALALRPDLIERLSRAVGAAKKKQAEAAHAEQANAQSGPRGAQDAKIWNKLKKLVESPFNDANRKNFDEIAEQGIDWDWAPESAPTVLRAALDYLAAKDRVEIDWPLHVIALSKSINAAEWLAACQLEAKRGAYSLGSEKASQFWIAALSCRVDWEEIEKKTKTSALFTALRVLTHHAGAKNRFEAARLAAKNGASFARFTQADAALRAKENKPANAPALEFWQQATLARFNGQDDQRERLGLMTTLIGLGQVTRGHARAVAGVPEASNATLVFLVGPARAYLSDLRHSGYIGGESRDWTHHALIFSALCETEDRQLDSPRLDRWGITRLRWANELANMQGAKDIGEATELMAVALRHGDEPESVSAANPVAWAQTDAAKKLLQSALERKELSAIARAASSGRATEQNKPTRAANRL